MYDTITEHAGWLKPTDVENIVKLEGFFQTTNFTNHQLPALETIAGGYEREPIDAAQQFYTLYYRSAHEWLLLNGLDVTDDVNITQRTNLIAMLIDIQQLGNIDVLQLALSSDYSEEEFLIGSLMEMFGYGRAVDWYDAFITIDAAFLTRIKQLAEEPDDATDRSERQTEIVQQFRNHIRVAANGRYTDTPIIELARSYSAFPLEWDSAFNQIGDALDSLGNDELGFNLYGLSILADLPTGDRVSTLQVLRADVYTDKPSVDKVIVDYHHRRMEVSNETV